jgi:hypothetical protein
MSIFDWSKWHPWSTLLNQDNVVLRVHEVKDLGLSDEKPPKPLELEFEVLHTTEANSQVPARAHVTQFRVTVDEWRTITAMIDDHINAAEQRRTEEQERRRVEERAYRA